MGFWKMLLAAVASNAIAVPVLTYLINQILTHRFTLAVEAYKQSLQKEVESYKGDLQKDLAKVSAELAAFNKRKEVELNWLHPERAKAAMKIFLLCANLGEAVRGLSIYRTLHKHNPIFDKQIGESRGEILKQLGELETLVIQNKPIFASKLNSQLEEFWRYAMHSRDSRDAAGAVVEMVDSTDRVAAIEKSIKEMLGVSDDIKTLA